MVQSSERASVCSGRRQGALLGAGEGAPLGQTRHRAAYRNPGERPAVSSSRDRTATRDHCARLEPSRLAVLRVHGTHDHIGRLAGRPGGGRRRTAWFVRQGTAGGAVWRNHPRRWVIGEWSPVRVVTARRQIGGHWSTHSRFIHAVGPAAESR